ncbi:succinate dehydrogenase assembly factor 2 [Roseovarius nanhaiticus]|uniref:FAD assembly factor SdhE n=1 Tax=Roseovarius nanhaiticus TaxID=573024 RepID=A0A1N7FMK6_9RHOB|nr:succinate dehydrogenase assembly factor 2 [Roseovarius nanhaiticus]SEK50864.1 antitoxin CptB [Roseovarius nanhaiticus]SIS01514.1 antitoxin CptB [Roseovarius nanhaiticus]
MLEGQGTRPVDEPRDIRLRRLTMRSMRRGIREMDILLMRFARARLDALSDAELDVYDALLEENDQDLYQWVSGQVAPPAQYGALIEDIASVPDTA